MRPPGEAMPGQDGVPGFVARYQSVSLTLSSVNRASSSAWARGAQDNVLAGVPVGGAGDAVAVGGLQGADEPQDPGNHTVQRRCPPRPRPLGHLAVRADEVPSGAVVHCGHGERAMTAASLLQRTGHQGLAVLDGGPADRARSTGLPLEEGA